MPLKVVPAFEYGLTDMVAMLRQRALEIEDGTISPTACHLVTLDEDARIESVYSAGRMLFTRHAMMGVFEDAKLYMAEYEKVCRGRPTPVDTA